MATAVGMEMLNTLYLKYFERGGDLNENSLTAELY